MKNIYLDFLETNTHSAGIVIATVTESHGSTPQKPGSSALFNSSGLISGTVGGGVVEAQVQDFALKSSATKESGYLHFSLSKDVSHRYEAICGGKISVLVDANPFNHLPVFEAVRQSLSENTPGVLITMVTVIREPEVLINRYWMTPGSKTQLPVEFMEKIGPEVMNMLSSGDRNDFRKLELSIPGEEPASIFFLELLLPPDHLIIAGAGHIGKALSHLGKILDFEVTVIDDREDFANNSNLPDADHIIVRDIGKAVQEIEKDSKTYIVIVTRGHSNDAEALRPCIGSDAAYIGMIGSRAKTAKMHKEFVTKKWATEEQWSKIFTPIGLEIGSKTVEEIAVSIAAQLILVRNGQK
jgi:xanthine dehydrogenase accessory factor